MGKRVPSAWEKLHLCQIPRKRRCLKSFPAASVQQGSAILQALIDSPRGGPEGGPREGDTSSCSATEPCKAAFRI